MATSTAEAKPRFLNRELSQLDFNGRVLEIVREDSVPLLERVNFCAIFSANMDEFFMVRVAGLMDQVAAGVAVRSPDGLTPQAALAEIRKRAFALAAEQAKLWKRTLRPALEAQGIVVAEIEDLEPAELEELERVFDREIFPVLTPLAVGPGQPFPYISGLSLSLGLFVRDPETGEERFARVKVPELLPRFLPIGSRGLFVPLERVIRHFLAWLFPMMEIVECTTFRVTRDADFSVSDEADDLLEAVELELRRRPFGDPVRLEISGSCSTRMLQQLKDGLDVVEEQVYLVPGLLDLVRAERARRARPARAEGGSVDAGGAGALRVRRPRRALRRAAQEPGARPPPVRLVRAHLRVVRANRGDRPEDAWPSRRPSTARATTRRTCRR